jgi:hypothetical protein
MKKTSKSFFYDLQPVAHLLISEARRDICPGNKGRGFLPKCSGRNNDRFDEVALRYLKFFSSSVYDAKPHHEIRLKQKQFNRSVFIKKMNLLEIPKRVRPAVENNWKIE